MSPMDVFAGCGVACVAWTAFLLGRGQRTVSFDRHADDALDVSADAVDELTARRQAKASAS